MNYNFKMMGQGHGMDRGGLNVTNVTGKNIKC